MSSDERAAAAIPGLYASLHVNVAARLHDVGRIEEARHHLAKADAAERDLPADGYGRLVRAQIDELGGRLNG